MDDFITTANEEQLVLKGTDRHIHTLNNDAHKFAFDIIFIGLKTKLDEVPTMDVSPVVYTYHIWNNYYCLVLWIASFTGYISYIMLHEK